jgi:hypothetical protein
MIKRILLLKFVSWVVLAPVLALAPTQHVRIDGAPHFSYPLRKWASLYEVGAKTPGAPLLASFASGGRVKSVRMNDCDIRPYTDEHRGPA